MARAGSRADWVAVKLVVGSMTENWIDGMIGSTSVCCTDEMAVIWDDLRTVWMTVKMIGLVIGCWVDGMAMTRVGSSRAG